MSRPVEQGAGEPLRSQNRCPVLEGEVRADNGRALLVALQERLEEQLGPGRRERHVAKFVDDQQLHGLQIALQLEKAPLVAGFHQLRHQGRRGRERHGEALLAGRQTQGGAGQDPGQLRAERHGSCRCRCCRAR